MISDTTIDVLNEKTANINWTNHFKMSVPMLLVYSLQDKLFKMLDSCRIVFDWRAYDNTVIGSQVPTKTECIYNFDFDYIGITNKLGVSVGDINKIITQFEEHLPDNLKTVVFKTNSENIALFKLSEFYKHRVRNSLFTLLLKLGNSFYDEDLGKAIDKYNLAARVKNSLLHYQKGNYNPIVDLFTRKFAPSSYFDYVSQYEGLTNKELGEQLLPYVKPD